MKVWLNNLKEGDIFYHILLDKVYKCKHLGDAHNMNFKMSRIKFEILDNDIIFNENLLGNIHEAFVNQYVYDNYNEALEALKEKLKDDYDITVKTIIATKQKLDNLEKELKRIKNLILKYDKNNS